LIAARTLTALRPVLKWLTPVCSREKRVRIFVTGRSGFLGSRMIRTLVNQRHEVFALARSTSSGERIRMLGATPITGDLERSEQLSFPEIETVVHAAAYFRFAGPRASYFRANVEGTRAVLTAA
jgi:nucleoside-diphosphate-sugar epimerase